MPDGQGSPDLATLLSEVNGGIGGSVTPPIVQSSLFTFDSYAEFEDRMSGHSDSALYTRVQNPTVAAFEAMMAKAEGGEAAVGFASGMAAISSALLAHLKPGDRVACVEHVYPDTYRFMERILRPFGIETDYHACADLEDDPELLKGVKVAYLESPTSVVFKALNLPKVAAHARRHGVTTMIDNSWATPVFQRPIELGIDIVIHSASKYISGHSDTVAGVVVSSKDHIARLRDLTLPLFGGKLAPFEAWLLIRGLRTLVPRMRQHQETADLFVDRLSALPFVKRVNSPSRNTVPGLGGRSGLMSVEFDDSIDVARLSDTLRHFRLGVSWGGFESLILPSRIGLAQAGDFNSMQEFGVSPQLVRLSLGLEGADDLWADMESALDKSKI
ncbi:aminotransferase class I/II-fold pyridoxal phosphate-dependent enzyme [Frigidibacter sp. ROC022]|uniref:aminotransferase class I/II-fold pyridoxal phosphate-dependent enzyme n=1 Tax=Frigidibacter sp. ROC022 TaxID=2971796 RepID=UPI00215B5F24|nr:aminotransferase class I/II-fold pyridoxal phosphate-dependent enzyme [Frigidibacter sp. ROC022]MCR8726094.1 aminotransferase class I/II-fold pyridoxal phosphate-dependent enzyme [Frigidibacter sp. ROC022]